MKRINLSDIPKQEPFTIPEGYLDKLPMAIQQEVQKPAGSWIWAQKSLMMPAWQATYAMVAILLIIALAQALLNTPEDIQKPIMANALLEETSQQEILTYLSTTANLSIQELASEGSWNGVILTQELESNAAIESEIIEQLDTYSAEELW